MKSTWFILGLAIATANALPYGKNIFSEFRATAPKVCSMLATPSAMKISFSPTVVTKLIAAWKTEYAAKLTVTQPLTSQGTKKIDNLKINLGASLRAMTKTAYIVSGMHACPCAQKISAAFVKKAFSTDCSAAKKPKICTTVINLVMQANPDRIELYNPTLTDVKSKYFTVGGTDVSSCEGENINRDFKEGFKAISTCAWNFAGATAETSKQATELKSQLASIKPGLLISIVSPKTGVTKDSLCYPPGQKTTMSDEFKKIAASVDVKAYTETDMGGTLVNQFYKTTTEMPKYAYELQCTDTIDVDKTVEGLIKLIDSEVDTPTVPTTVSTVSTTKATTTATTKNTATTVKPTTKSNSTTMKPSSATTKPNSATTKMPVKTTSAKPSTAKPASTNAATKNSAATNKATTMASTPKSAPTGKATTMASTPKPPISDKTTTNPPPTPQDEKEKAFAMVGRAPLGEFFNKSVLKDAQDFLASTYKVKVNIKYDNSSKTFTGKSFQITEAKPFRELKGKGPGKLRKKVLILGGNILTTSVLGAVLSAKNGDSVRDVIFEAVADINPDRENGKTKNALPDATNKCTPATLGTHIMSNFPTNWVATTDPCAPKYSGKQAGEAAEVKFMEKLANDRSPDYIVSLIYNEDSCAKAQFHHTATNAASFATNFKAGYDGATPTTETITIEKTDYPGNAIGSLSTSNSGSMVFAICTPKTSTSLQVGELAGKIVAGLSKALA